MCAMRRKSLANPISIKDIARMADVSHSTVSRALRNSPLISAQTTERIHRIAEQSQYRASAVARSLVTRHTRTVGIVVTTIADPFAAGVVDGIEDAATAYKSSRHWHPAGSSDDLYFSRAMAEASRAASNPILARMALQQAFNAAERAPKSSEERQNAWYNLAAFYATQNDAADVEACLRHSMQASPNWFKPHWALAQTLLLAGRRTEALAEGIHAVDLDGGKDPDVAKFLQSVHDLPALSKTE